MTSPRSVAILRHGGELLSPPVQSVFMNGTESVPAPAPSATEVLPAIGFAGLGRMGFPLAQRLSQSGLPVVAFNRTRQKSEALAALGARWVATPRDLAKSIGKGITFVMLTDAKAVQSVLFGRSGYAKVAPPGALVVDLTTIDPEESRAFSARLAERGIHYLDAPVGGSVDQAARGEVMFFVGGEEQDLARARPLLERVGQRVDHMGPVGAGTSMKLVNNLLTIGITTLSTEALALADGFHLDRARVLEVLQAGGGRSAMLERKSPAFVTRQYPAQFTTTLARKDLKLVEKAASREGRVLKMTREARKLIDEAIAQGHSEEDFSSVLEATLLRGRRTSPAPAPTPAPEGSSAPG
ncbi:MAG TPA: NAD(P)-dependent oxidoreductase [Thermoplasmata archaeon]|nr:NAD(P)-dependent oxidoreductase [Thermoplasmata archaeon]